MTTKDYDFTIPQGSTYHLIAEWKTPEEVPISTVGYKARLQIRRRKDSPGTLLSLTSDGGDIVLGGANGRVTATITSATAALLKFKTAKYDLELYNTDSPPYVKRLLQGTVTLDWEVTR